MYSLLEVSSFPYSTLEQVRPLFVQSPSAVFCLYHANKRLGFRVTLKDGKDDGICQAWDENGKLLLGFEVRNGQRHGVYGEWDGIDTIVAVRHYADNWLHGFCAQYYSHGTMKRCGFRENGLMQGLWQWWKSDGKKLCFANYKDDKMHGLSIGWDDDYKLKEMYSDGILHGPFERFYKNGVVGKSGKYEYGQKQGTQLGFYEDGSPRSMVQYSKGKKHVLTMAWKPTGELITRELYFHGRQLKQEQLWRIVRFLQRCKWIRLARIVKTEGFQIWWCSPQNVGGQLIKKQIDRSLSSFAGAQRLSAASV